MLYGGPGADTMIRGDGYDTYRADDLGDVIVEDAPPAGAGELEAYYYSQDRVYWTGAGQYVLAANVEYLHLIDGATQGLGNAQANILFSDYGFDEFGVPLGSVELDGAGGDDTVIGAAGLDTVRGGGDDDRVRGSYSADLIHGDDGDDDLDGGAPESGAADDGASDTLLGGAGSDRLDGNFGDDSLNGGDDSDDLYGNYGDDTLTGGAGADRFSGGPGVNVVTDFVDGEDLILAGRNLDGVQILDDEGDTLIRYADDFVTRLLGIDSSLITVDDFLFLLAGDEGDNTLTGGSGTDFVDGGDGADNINGAGGGDDVDGGYGDDAVSGGAGDDTVDGGAGDDTMLGGSGQDAMAGGDGDDTYVVDAGDTVEEEGGEGTDTVVASESYGLGVNLENLTLGDGGVAAPSGAFSAKAAAPRIDGRGNGLDNLIQGSTGVNRLLGSDGKDTLNGAGGNDSLLGGKGNDKLDGSYGRDTLWGDAGRDVLKGGAGADVFAFRSLNDTGDKIRDFAVVQGDVIDLSMIDAKAARDGDQAFRFVDAFTGRQGQAILTYDAAGDTTVLRLDVDGDRAADFVLSIDGHASAGDGWVL